MEFLKNHNNILPNDWSTEFSSNIVEEFTILELIRTNLNIDKASTSPSFTSTILSSSSSYNNIKINIKKYPSFNGDIKEWKKYMILFDNVATIHG